MNVSAMEANAVFANSDSCAKKKNLIDSITYFLRQYTPESHPDATLMREQALYVPCMFSKLCRSYSEAMREDGRAMDAIVPLQAAVEMSRPEPETVVSLFLCVFSPLTSVSHCQYTYEGGIHLHFSSFKIE